MNALKELLGNPADKYEVVDRTLCPKPPGAKFHKMECINRKCPDCGVHALRHELSALADEDEVNT